MSLDEKLTIYETVISALRNKRDMTELTDQLPMEYQVEVVRFMEFLEENKDSTNSNGTSSRKH